MAKSIRTTDDLFFTGAISVRDEKIELNPNVLKDLIEKGFSLEAQQKGEFTDKETRAGKALLKVEEDEEEAEIEDYLGIFSVLKDKKITYKSIENTEFLDELNRREIKSIKENNVFLVINDVGDYDINIFYKRGIYIYKISIKHNDLNLKSSLVQKDFPSAKLRAAAAIEIFLVEKGFQVSNISFSPLQRTLDKFLS
jgi:hypothetical protein